MAEIQLPNKVVYLVPNPRAVLKDYMGIQNHDGCFMYTGTATSWVLPYKNPDDGGGWVNPFNSNEEMEWLSQKLGMNLDIYKKDNDFKTYRITVRKNSEDLGQLKMELRLNNPVDYLKYLVLRVQNDVAPNWEKRDERNKEYRWVLRETGEENQLTINHTKAKVFAYSWLGSNQNNRSKLFNILRVLGYNYDAKVSAETLYIKMSEIIESTTKELKKLITVIQDKQFDLKIDIEYYVLCGEIKKTGASYYLSSGERIGSMEDVINFVQEPKNSVMVEGFKIKAMKYKQDNNLM